MKISYELKVQDEAKAKGEEGDIPSRVKGKAPIRRSCRDAVKTYSIQPALGLFFQGTGRYMWGH